MCVPHSEFEAEALRDEELEIEDVRRQRLWNVGGVRLERYGVVGRLRRKEESGQPGANAGAPAKRSQKGGSDHAYITFLGCQSITVFLR
jgi:hypothetical protein